MLDGENIREALALPDAELGKRGIRGEICLFGGAVMVLAYQARQPTKDVDAFFAPTGPIRELAAHLASKRGWEPDWINDGVKGWLSKAHRAQARHPDLALVLRASGCATREHYPYGNHTKQVWQAF